MTFRPLDLALIAVVLVGLVGFMSTAGCAQTNPSAPSASGRIQYVVIDDGISDSSVRVQAGVEVRWVNVRLAPVSVVFNGLQAGQLSCKRGFSASADAHMTAVILPDENASLCIPAAGRKDLPRPRRATSGRRAQP
jgi:hypothetical protein